MIEKCHTNHVRDELELHLSTKIKSSQRTLALFEFYSLEQRPLSIKEIADGLEMPQSSTSVLVQSLVELGYLEKDEKARTFYPTLRISLLGSWMGRQHKRAGKLPGLLHEVCKKTGESTILAMRNGIYSQYVIAHPGKTPNTAIVESGQLYPLACCATGWCLLTLESTNNLEKIIRRTVSEAKHDYWRESAKSALENVALTQRQGYAFSKGETVSGLGAIATLLPSIPGAYAMAAGVGGRIPRIEKKQDQILKALETLSSSVRHLAAQSEPMMID